MSPNGTFVELPSLASGSSSGADRNGPERQVVVSRSKAPERPRHPSAAGDGAGGGGRAHRWRAPSCAMLVTVLLLMKAGVILASVTTERDNQIQLLAHPTKSTHHQHHHHNHGHGRHSTTPEPSATGGEGGTVAPKSHHKFRHSGGVDISCSKCPPGWGVIARCHPKGRGDPSSPTDDADAQWDTACAPCPKSFHSPHHSATAKCWPCSRCGPGLFESHPCTPKSDTVCDSCLTARARPLGADFDRKCLFGRASGDVRWLSDEVEDRDEDAMAKRVQRMTVATSAAFRLSGQMRPRGEGGGEEEAGEGEEEGEEEGVDGGSSREGNEERQKVQQRRGGERNETAEVEGEDHDNDSERSAGITWGVVSIAAFQFSVFAAAAVAVCHYLRKMHSCLAEDRERTAQEINPLMEVTPIH